MEEVKQETPTGAITTIEDLVQVFNTVVRNINADMNALIQRAVNLEVAIDTMYLMASEKDEEFAKEFRSRFESRLAAVVASIKEKQENRSQNVQTQPINETDITPSGPPEEV